MLSNILELLGISPWLLLVVAVAVVLLFAPASWVDKLKGVVQQTAGSSSKPESRLERLLLDLSDFVRVGNQNGIDAALLAIQALKSETAQNVKA